MDGTTLAVTSKAQLAGQPAHAIDVTELRQKLDPKILGPGDLVVLTGTAKGGTVGKTCADWSSHDANEQGTYGFVDMLDGWTSFAAGGCQTDNVRLYCFRTMTNASARPSELAAGEEVTRSAR